MQIGLLTTPFGSEDLEHVAAFASKAGFDALEVAAGPGSAQIDPFVLPEARAEKIKKLLKKKGLALSSLAYYANVVDPDAEKRDTTHRHLRATVDAAVRLGTDIVCTLAGMPLPGKNKMQTIEEDLPGALGPIVEYAASKGIKIALENWFATNIQHLEHWERLFEVLPAENFGLNFDPSHLYWQQIDYLEAVDRFADRIFHTHAKDCEVRAHRLRRVGVLESGWWRYVIPGFGKIHWGEYIAALKRNGYDGVLSIEHEDGALGREEGFVRGAAYLKQFA